MRYRSENVILTPREFGAIIVADGEMHQWTGRGRTPKVFQAYFDKGGSKESCLIK
jgi:DNA-binding protein H-NS